MILCSLKSDDCEDETKLKFSLVKEDLLRTDIVVQRLVC